MQALMFSQAKRAKHVFSHKPEPRFQLSWFLCPLPSFWLFFVSFLDKNQCIFSSKLSLQCSMWPACMFTLYVSTVYTRSLMGLCDKRSYVQPQVHIYTHEYIMECAISVLCKNYLQTTSCWLQQTRIGQSDAKAAHRWDVVLTGYKSVALQLK